MESRTSLLIPGGTYHIYNRANGMEKIFLSAENYRFFMSKVMLYMKPVANIYCYCLMPNHFHFLVRIKTEPEIISNLNKTENEITDLEKLVSKQFSNLFSSYTQAFNKQQGRMGSLFMKNFKRKKVDDENYFRNLVYYIHHNPVEAGLSDTPEGFKYSSYYSIIENTGEFVLRDELISYFEDLENFIGFHKKSSDNFGKVILEGSG